MYEKTTKERWKPIKGYVGSYEVSNLGRIRSLDRFVKTKGAGKRLIKGKLLKRKPEQDGYQRIQLYQKQKYINRYVHCLAMETFVGPCPEGQQVLHLTPVLGGGGDELSNLRYGSATCNMAFKYDDGTNIRGEKSSRAKLSKHDAITIKYVWKMLDLKYTRAELGRLLGVKERTISAVLSGQNWKHIRI